MKKLLLLVLTVISLSATGSDKGSKYDTFEALFVSSCASGYLGANKEDDVIKANVNDLYYSYKFCTCIWNTATFKYSKEALVTMSPLTSNDIAKRAESSISECTNY